MQMACFLAMQYLIAVRARQIFIWETDVSVCGVLQLVSWYDNEWGYSNRVSIASLLSFCTAWSHAF